MPALIEAKPYKSGEVKTNETFVYGRFTTRMWAAWANGTVSSFFMYWDEQNKGSHWNEIDVELVPSMANGFSMNIIWENHQTDHNYLANFVPFGGWNEYVIEWTPEHVRWKINKETVRTSTGSDVKDLNRPMHVMMDFWTPTWSPWSDNFTGTNMPWYTKYDYVKVEKYNASTGGFDFYWQDDFDSFDYSRWQKSNGWSFESNSSTFYESQVYTENGALVLKMEKPWSEADHFAADEENETKTLAELIQ